LSFLTNGHVHFDSLGQGIEWHMYFLIDQLDYNNLFHYMGQNL